MNVKDTKTKQKIRLKEIAIEMGINYEYLNALLESVKIKKLLKRNNYHQQKINDVIEKATK